MKKIIISSIVGAIIVFIIQAASWMVLPIHKHSLKHTPAQDSIMEALSSNLQEDGVYMLPYLDPDKSTKKEMQKFEKASVGKPWAMVYYHQTMQAMTPGQLILGFLFNLFAVLVIAIILHSTQNSITSFGGKYLLVIGFVLFSLFQGSLINWNWWSIPGHYLSGEIIDHLLVWGIAGIWLAWYYRK
jgi:hypothetical protein